MNTAGGNDEKRQEAIRRIATELDIPPEHLGGNPVPPARDPSVRDVLAQLDRIEGKIDTLAAVAATWLREQDANA